MDNYTQIKRAIGEATALAESGDFAQADAKVRVAIPLGMSKADLSANMPKATIRKMREWKRAQ
jgi:hypothetical protein